MDLVRDEQAGLATRLVLDRLAELGSFFAVRSHAVTDRPAPPWRQFGELVQQPERLAARVDSVRSALAADVHREPEQVEHRVAASVAHLGLVARLIAPALAVATLGVGGFRSQVSGLWWQDQLGGPFPLSMALSEKSCAAGRVGAHRDVLGVIEQCIVPLSAAMARHGVSTRGLWGNVASAVNSAAVLIAGQQPVLARPALAIARAVLSDGRFRDEPHPPGSGFRRRSCCLIYRIADEPSSAFCGDCVLVPQRG